MTIDPSVREFKFEQGQSLTDIITQCVLSSNYAKNAIVEKNINNQTNTPNMPNKTESITVIIPPLQPIL
jgi:hypothetical protein